MKAVGFMWISAITAFPIIGQLIGPTTESKLATGSAQVVLSIIVLALSGVVVWQAKRREDDWARREKDWEQQTARLEKMSKEILEAFKGTAVALSESTEERKRSTDALYHIANVVKQCQGNSFTEPIIG